MVKLLTGNGPRDLPAAEARGEALWIDAGDVETALGYRVENEGLCSGDSCVPWPKGFSPPAAGARFDVAGLWRRLGSPVVHDSAGEIWVLGEGAEIRARELESLEAPDFELEDLAGGKHTLSDYRGRKILLVTWASW
jgi:hypothetical protein